MNGLCHVDMEFVNYCVFFLEIHEKRAGSAVGACSVLSCAVLHVVSMPADYSTVPKDSIGQILSSSLRDTNKSVLENTA